MGVLLLLAAVVVVDSYGVIASLIICHSRGAPCILRVPLRFFLFLFYNFSRMGGQDQRSCLSLLLGIMPHRELHPPVPSLMFIHPRADYFLISRNAVH